MNTTAVKLMKLQAGAKTPTYGSASAAGADLYAYCPEGITVAPGQTVLIHTGVAMEIPDGLVGLIYARSGLATKRGLAPANKVGVIDSDYRGEIMVSLHNHGTASQTVEHGERVAQIVIAPYIRAEFCACADLSETERGSGGFGSTGNK